MASYLQKMKELEELKKKTEQNALKPKPTNKGVSSGTPSVSTKTESKQSFIDKVSLANEKASRLYAQNAADMYAPKATVKTSAYGPQQWNGVSNDFTPIGTSAVKAGPQRWSAASAGYLTPVNTVNTAAKTKTADVLPSVFDNKGLNASEVWAKTSMELPAVTSQARQGTGIFDRVYNALSSIGDSKIGADLSLKATAKQSVQNEKDYRTFLREFNDELDYLILARNKYSPNSAEYKKYNDAINELYASANGLRDRSADMSEANVFMENAGKLRNQATAGMGTVGRNLTGAAISVGDNLTTMALTGFNPTAAVAMMGVSAAGQRTNELSNKGARAGDALGRGILSGVIEGLTEKIGIDSLYDIVGGNKVSLLSNLFKQAASEGTEEGLSSILNFAVDRMAGDKEKFDWDDMAQSVIQGALSGAMFGLGGTFVNYAAPKLSGYSDMAHLNMDRELAGKSYSDILPKAGRYSADTSNVNVNIGEMSASEYLDYVNGQNTLPKVEMPETTGGTKSVYDVNKVKLMPDATNNDIADFVINGVSNKNQGQYLKLREVSSRLSDDLKKIGLNINGFVHALKDNNIRHIDKSHGSKSNDKYKVGINEYLLLSDIYENYDNLYKGYNTKEGRTSIAYEKRYENKIYVVEEVFEEGVLAPKQIIVTGIKSRPSFLKKYTKISGEYDTDVSEYKLRSTDYKYNPPGNHVQDANSSANNNIPETFSESNTNLKNIETRVFDNSDPLNLLTDENVAGYKYITEEARKAGKSSNEIFRQYKEERDGLINGIVNAWFDIYKDYKPQGTQLINTTENMGGGTVDRTRRISNNEAWYSEAYREYGHKPNRSQLREFIGKKVEADIRRGGGEYVDADMAAVLNDYDNFLDGYSRVTDNGTRDVADIRLNQNGDYEVDYSNTPSESFTENAYIDNQGNIDREKAKTSMRFKNWNEYTPAKRKTISEYIKAVDESIVAFVNKYRQTENAKAARKTISKMGERQISDVNRLLNGDYSGYSNAINSNTIKHIDKRHGLEGIADTSMSLAEDIARVGYILDNYDTVEILKDNKGNIIRSREFLTANGEQAPILLYKKQIDGTYYTAQAVVDGRYKKNWVLTAYLNKEGITRMLDAEAPSSKSSETPSASLPSKNIVPNSKQKVNGIGNNNLGIVSPDAQAIFEAASKLKEESKDLYQSVISGTAPFERMAKADTRQSGRNIYAVTNRYAQKGGTVDTILTRGLFDINGNKVDSRSLVEVASQVPKDQLAAFNDYWHELHNIARQEQGKPVTAHTAEESKRIAAQYEAEHPEFKTYRENISDYYDKFIRTWGVGSGLISQESYLAMKKMYPYYLPTFRVDDGVSGGGSVKSGKKIRGGNAIGRAKGSTAEVMSFDEAFAQKINSVITAATKNDISREIFSFAQALPADAARCGILIDTDTSGQYAGQMDIDDLMDGIDKNIARQISKGNYEITFYNEGKPQTMKISRDVWEAYNFLDNKLGDTNAFKYAAKLGRIFTNPMRALTTTYNPLFFMTNLMRDAQTYTMNNTAKNSAVAMKNYVKAIKGIVTQSDTFDQYKSLGGSQNGYYGGNMYANAERSVNPTAKTAGQRALGLLRSPLTAIEGLGEFTEKIPRYAEYLNTIDRLGDTDSGRMQASLNAADVTVNFNRSSTLSSLANSWVPYFNAGLQGMDKTFRQIKSHPVQTTARATVSVFLPTLLLFLVNKDNPHWEDVKDGVRDNYYLIPNYRGPVDEKGFAETFIRLPKSREFGALFSASFERFMRAFDSEDDSNTLPDAFDGYLDTLLNSFMPNSVLDDNIFGAIKRLGTNTAWHGGKIVPSNLENVSPQYQYDINTSGVAKNVADFANTLPYAPNWLKSPMKLDYLIDSYGGYAGDLVQGVTSRKNIGATTGETVRNGLYSGFVQPVKNRFTTDSAYSNYNLDRFYDRTDELETAANDRNHAENLPTEYVTPEEKVKSDFTKTQNVISDLSREEKAILESPMPMAEKNKKIRELKKEKNRLAKDMLSSEDELYAIYADRYVPEISNLSDKRQDTARELNQKYGLSYSDYAELYEKYAELNKDESLDAKMKATEMDEILTDYGYPKGHDIRADLEDEFTFFSMAPADSYYDSKSYKMVENFMPVDMYAYMKELVNGVDYPDGQRSPYYKSAIDQFLAEYGYNPSYNQRMKIYESMGVAKSYRY